MIRSINILFLVFTSILSAYSMELPISERVKRTSHERTSADEDDFPVAKKKKLVELAETDNTALIAKLHDPLIRSAHFTADPLTGGCCSIGQTNIMDLIRWRETNSLFATVANIQLKHMTSLHLVTRNALANKFPASSIVYSPISDKDIVTQSKILDFIQFCTIMCPQMASVHLDYLPVQALTLNPLTALRHITDLSLTPSRFEQLRIILCSESLQKTVTSLNLNLEHLDINSLRDLMDSTVARKTTAEFDFRPRIVKGKNTYPGLSILTDFQNIKNLKVQSKYVTDIGEDRPSYLFLDLSFLQDMQNLQHLDLSNCLFDTDLSRILLLNVITLNLSDTELDPDPRQNFNMMLDEVNAPNLCNLTISGDSTRRIDEIAVLAQHPTVKTLTIIHSNPDHDENLEPLKQLFGDKLQIQR